MVAALYERFRQRAHHKLQHERVGHTLATSDLTHEAILRSSSTTNGPGRPTDISWSALSRSMHQVLIDQARRRNAHKRGGVAQREPLDDLFESLQEVIRFDALSLDEALRALADEYPREADVWRCDSSADAR